MDTDVITDEVILRVTHASDERLQVIEDPFTYPEGELVLSQWEFCAEGGDVDFNEISNSFDRHNADLVLNFRLTGDDTDPDNPYQLDRENLYTGNDMVNVTTTDIVFRVNDDECETYEIVTDMPFSEDNSTRMIQPSIEEIFVYDDVRVIYDTDDYRSRGVKTVFDPGEGIDLFLNNYDGEEVVVSRDSEYFTVGRFRYTTEDYNRGEISSTSFSVDIEPDEALLPLKLFVEYSDNEGRYYGLGGFSDIVADGDVITWEPSRPDGSLVEDISYNARLVFDFEVPFVTDEADSVQIEAVSTEAEQQVVAHREDDDRTSFVMNDESTETLPWSNVVFTEPSGGPLTGGPGILLRWREYSLSQATHYVWPGSSHEHCDDPITTEFEYCPVMDLEGEINIPDERFNLNINSIVIGVDVDGYEGELDFLIEDATWEGGVTRTFTHRASLNEGYNRLEFPVEWEIDPDRTGNIRVRAIPVNVPEEDPDAFIPPRFGFTVESIDATYAGSILNSYIDAPEEVGEWGFDFRPLPYEACDYVMHGPEIWLNSNTTGVPTVISIEDYNSDTPDTEILLYENEWHNRFGAVEVCSLQFIHGTDKNYPPEHAPDLSVNWTTIVLVDWDRERAFYQATDGIHIRADEIANVRVSMVNPREDSITSDMFPYTMELVEMVVVPDGSVDGCDSENLVPVIIGLDGDERIELSEENSITGIPTHITE